MLKKLLLKILLFSVGVMLLFCPRVAFCQNAFESLLKHKMDSLSVASARLQTQELLPNDAVQSVMTPTGFGGYGAYIFGGLGGTYPQVYTKKADLIGSVGFCVGNPTKAINFATSLNITKVKTLSDMSANFIVSRKLWTGTSISAGVLQVFAGGVVSDAPNATYYAAFSHAVQWVHSKSEGSSALTYTIGVGNGRFWQKSPADILAGKGAHGTGVFGDISFEVFRRVNLNAEWNGMNLGFSTGIRPFSNSTISLGIGITNLTNYSADKPSMVFSMGYPLSLNRKIN